MALAEQFLLDPQITFLNHGSFGATPRPVFEAYQEWQRRLEWQPVQFTITDLPNYLAEARTVLANYINSDAGDLVYIPNATFGLNIVAHALDLGPGDEVLMSDHEYGACENVWQFYSRKRGFSVVQRPLPLPATSQEELLEQLWTAVTPHTKVIFISHISSSTALRLPIEAICHRARAAGILTVIDGAHALGQIPLDLQHIDPDFYFSNAHKWLCSPKGSAFLYTRHDKQALIEPLVIGWGWGAERTFTFGSDYLDYLQYLGTNDLAAYLSVPAAIKFQHDYDWPTVRANCRQLLSQAIQRICDLTGLAMLYPDDPNFYMQMAIAPLPPIADLPHFKTQLLEAFQVEIPLIQWHECQFIRISVQGYNTQADIDRLLIALETLLPRQKQYFNAK